MLPQWHVKDPGHSAKSAGGRLHLDTHTPFKQRSSNGLIMMSGHSVGKELTRGSRGNARPQSFQLAEPLWVDRGLDSGTGVREGISTLNNNDNKCRRGMVCRSFPQNSPVREKSHRSIGPFEHGNSRFDRQHARTTVFCTCYFPLRSMPRKKNESLHTALKGSPHMLSLPWDLWKKLVSKHSVKGEPTHAIAPMEFVIIIINPLTARVVGAPQMILQPVFSIFPCSPLPSGTCRTPGLSIP